MLETEDSILINIIGTGYDLRLGKLNKNDYDVLCEIKSKKTNSLNTILFTENFYTTNKITDIYKSWNDFNDLGIYRGANIFEKGQIEIWVNRKRKKTYLLSEITNSVTLFPLFNLQQQSYEKKAHQIAVGVQEKGCLSKYKFTTPKLLISELQLNIIEFNFDLISIKMLYDISYNGIKLKPVKSDTLITGTICEIE